MLAIGRNRSATADSTAATTEPSATDSTVSSRCWTTASRIWSHSSTIHSQRMMGLVASAMTVTSRRRESRLARIVSSVTTPPKRPPSSMTAAELCEVMISSMALRSVLSGVTCAAGRTCSRSATASAVQQVVAADPTDEDAVADHADPVGATGIGDSDRVDGRGADVDDRALVERKVGHRLQREPLHATVLADELLDELVGRGPQDLVGRGVLLEDPADVQQGDAVGQLERLVDVVGHEHDRLVHLLLQGEQLVLESGPHDRVDRAERLVHQQHRRVGGEGAGHADPLLLAAGQLVRVAVDHRRLEADELGQLCDPVGGALLVPARGSAARWRCSGRPCGAGTARPAGSRSRCRGGAR